jgi:hypothetical protein
MNDYYDRKSLYGGYMRITQLFQLPKAVPIASAIVAVFAISFLAVSVLIGMPPIGYIIMVTFIRHNTHH